MYKLDKLTKIYARRDAEVCALDGVTLQIQPGSFVVVTGGSGSGKTTLLLTLGGIIHPTSGSLLIKGQDLYGYSANELADYRNRTIGFVLQTFNLVPYLTVLENVMVPMLLSTRNGDGRESRAAKLLAQVGLDNRQQFLPRELSVGQQQRVAIARALANDPEVILADEPTGNLDPTLSGEILTILKDLNLREKRTIIMVTHSPQAAEFGTARFHLDNGKLAA